MLGVDVSAESSGLDTPQPGEASVQSGVVVNHVHRVQTDTVGAAQPGKKSVPTCESRRERERERESY